MKKVGCGAVLVRNFGSSRSSWPSRFGAVTATAIGLALLAACSTPPVKDRVVEVVKPVAIQPITPAQVPVPPAPLGPRPQSLSSAADLLLSKVCEFVAYTLKADPLLKVSSGQAPTDAPKYPECER